MKMASMKKGGPKTKHIDDLRKRAEKKIQVSMESTGKMSAPEIQKLVHELHVHQIEVEMQNEALRKSQMETAESQYKYSDLYDFAPVGYFTFDKKGRIIEANVTGASLLGAEKRSLANQPFQRFIIPGHFSIFQSHLQKAHELRSKQTCKLKLTGKDGSLFDALIDTIVVINGEGKFDHYRSAVTDITEITKAEELLHRTEENFRRSLDDSPLGVRIVTVEGETIYANRAVLDIYGYDSIEEMRSTPVVKRYTPESFAEFQTRKEKRKRGDYSPSEYEISIVRKDGEIRHLHVFRKEVLWDGERQFQVLYNDITERTRVEEELRFSNILLSTQQEVSIDGILVIDEKGKILSFNQQFVRMWGIPPEVMGARSDELAIKAVLDILVDPQGFLEKVNYLYAHGNETSRDEIFLKDGRIFDRYSAPMLGADAKNYGRVWYFRDITERKRAEEALYESRERYRSLFENMLDGYAYCRLLFEEGRPNDFIYLDVNTSFEKLTGLKNVIGRKVSDVIPGIKEANSKLFEIYGRVAMTGKPERVETYLDSLGIWLYIAVYSPEKDHFVAVFDNVTEQKRADEALKASHQQLRAFAGRLQSVREEQRKQIAREIHDELGGALTALKIDLSFLTRIAPKSRDKTKRDYFLSKILEMTKLIDRTIGTVRSIVTELRPSILDDFGLLAALEWQLEEFEKRTGIQCKLVSTMAYVSLDEERSIAVFRIFQESLTNVARHANATKVTAALYKEADNLVLKVEDDGKGISEDDIHNVKSIGLIGMRERALFLRGTANFSGEPSKGTTVSLQFPFES